MEYVSKILNLGSTREGYEYDYKYYIRNGRDVRENGVDINDRDVFYNYEFNTTEVFTNIGFNTYLEMGYPILLDLDVLKNDGAFPVCAHEVVIVGYMSDKSDYYIYADPSDGKYRVLCYWDIPQNSSAYAIKGKK